MAMLNNQMEIPMEIPKGKPLFRFGPWGIALAGGGWNDEISATCGHGFPNITYEPPTTRLK